MRIFLFGFLWLFFALYFRAVYRCWEEYKEQDDYDETGLLVLRDFVVFFVLYGYFGLLKMLKRW